MPKENVAARIKCPSRRLLRRHIHDGSYNRAGPRVTFGECLGGFFGRRRLFELGQTKIG
jgi:hypothetical protein